jgi:hypothetical protein
MLKRGKRSRRTIPDVWQYSHLPFYRRRARRCVQLAQLRRMLETDRTDQNDDGCIVNHDRH